IGTNDRRFVSQGVQTVATHQAEGESWLNVLEVGLRLHNDSIDRNHTEVPYLVSAGALIPEGGPTETERRNTGEAIAFAAHIRDEATFWRLTLTPGLRVEVIETDLTDALTGESQQNGDVVLVP